MVSSSGSPSRKGGAEGRRPRLWRRTYSTYSAPTWPVAITSAMAWAVAVSPKSSASSVRRTVSRVERAGAGCEDLEVAGSELAERREFRRQHAQSGTGLFLEKTRL